MTDANIIVNAARAEQVGKVGAVVSNKLSPVGLLQLLADGLSLACAADKLGVTYGGAKNYLNKFVYPELKANGMAHAVAIAIRKGMIR